MTNEKYSASIYSSHRKLQVTFDGDLIDAIRGEHVIKAIKDYDLLNHVSKLSEVIKSRLSGKVDNFRRAGFLLAFDFDNRNQRDNFFKKAYENKLLLNPTGEKSVRLRPNLAASKDEVDEICSIIENSL